MWGHANIRSFYKENLNGGVNTLPNIVSGEYFIDTDPGFGSGNSIGIVQGTDLNSLSFTADVTSLSEGFHRIFTRFKDATGHWSHTNLRSFYKEIFASSAALSNITKIEYFVEFY